MGYTTDFYGTLSFNKPVTNELRNYINAFSSTRRMQRDNETIKKIYPNWKEMCFNGNLGEDGEFFVTDKGFMGQDNDESVVNYNFPSINQPGLWCQWIINDNGDLEWDGGEKFYHYTEWLQYMIDNFFAPNGYVLNGNIEWHGEEYDDFGTIMVSDNSVHEEYGYIENQLAHISDNMLIEEVKSRGYVVSSK